MKDSERGRKCAREREREKERARERERWLESLQHKGQKIGLKNPFFVLVHSCFEGKN